MRTRDKTEEVSGNFKAIRPDKNYKKFATVTFRKFKSAA
jgi:hypothetical protein